MALTIVTGGGRGIGAAICIRLGQAGHDIVFGYRADDARAAATADARAGPRRRHAPRCGWTSPIRPASTRSSTPRLLPVTGLVNNAGIVGPTGKLVDVPIAELPRVFETNVVGLLLCCRRAAQAMAPGGAIVNISSGAATLGAPGEYVHYAASKAAVDTITIGLAKELGPDGIRVNAVAPGVVWTEIHADPERPAKLAPQIPLGRAGQPRGDRRRGRVAAERGGVLHLGRDPADRRRSLSGGTPGSRGGTPALGLPSYGVVVLSENVSVLLYVPARSTSPAPIA